MAVLNISLIGPFSAVLDSQPIQHFKTDKVQALLSYLVMERDQIHQPENLIALLWSGTPLESAQVNLRQTLYRLQQAIPAVSAINGDASVPLVVSDQGAISLNPQAALHLDVDQFLACLETDPARAVSLYRGDFLANFHLTDSPPFEEWIQSHRTDLKRKVLSVLGALCNSYLRDGDLVPAQSYAWRQLEIDNLRESAYRQLMLALAGDGQRSASLSQFQICNNRLEKELGISSSQETVALYEQIQAEALSQVETDPNRYASVPSQDMPVFLLTDIEGSTRLWDRYHQEMLPALLKHNAILEKHIKHHGGRILELRGDGVKAVFEGCNPLACMIAIQRDFGNTDWGEIGAMKIRAGLHGVPKVRKGYDYFKEDDKYYGPVLNHTARIMDAGWGGQVLVSENIHNSCPLPPGAAWLDFGLHNLKSLDQPVHIYGLTHPDMPDQSFPPLRTLTPPEETPKSLPGPIPHNLPPQPTPFVGRQKELADFATLLADPAMRLVTLVGPGGMGKTRLALTIAENQYARCSTQSQNCSFPDGVFFVPLASLDNPDKIIPMIAKSLNVPIETVQSTETMERASQTSTSQKESLAGYLRAKRMLIILDNFEHLLEGAEIVSDLLQMGASIQILVTSRERLHLHEEQVYPISGLDFPDWEAPLDPGGYTAMELFLQSARRVNPGFRLDPDDMVYLTRICHLVGGMPLGLELAASWVDLLPIQEIAVEIQASFDFLETDVRNIPERHRNMRAVFDSSWARLNETEKRIFPRLSIFRGDFNRRAAQEVAQASLRTLSTFVSKSLLQFDQGTHNYRIHELLRQYGAERLAAIPQDEIETRRCHSAFYCQEVDQHIHLFLSGQTQTGLDRIENDFANIITAWDWATHHGDLLHANQALTGICMFYNWSWRVDEALSICQDGLEMLARLGLAETSDPDIGEDEVLAKRFYARLLFSQGYLNLHVEHNKATRLLAQSDSILDQLTAVGADVCLEKAQVLFYQGLVGLLSGDLEIAKQRFIDTLTISKEIGLQWLVLRTLSMLGDVARASGTPREAKQWYRQCLSESQIQENRWGEILALHDLGWAARSLMAYDEAEGYYQESLELSRTGESRWEMVAVLESLGWLSLFLGNLKPALERFSEAVSISRELGIPNRTIPAQVHVGITWWFLGNFDEAEQTIVEINSTAQELNPAARIFPTICYAEFLAISGRYREASGQLDLLETLTQDLFIDRFTDGRLARVTGWVALALKNYAEAETQFRRSIELYQVNSDDEQITWSQAGLACALMGQHRWEAAHQLLIETLWTSIEMRAFIPLAFSLPMVVLYLAHKAPDQAAQVYAQIQNDPFIANAPLFEDIVYQYLPKDIRMKSGPDEGQLPQDHEILWSAAAGVLSNWIQVWVKEPEFITPQAEENRGISWIKQRPFQA